MLSTWSFRKNLDEKYVLPIEGQIVQDANQIDEIGAVGVAHVFYYDGHVGNLNSLICIPIKF
ncbi:MAG: hypothetical protein LBC39_00860 [Methanobrevibacter sp.]|nr:hypothetical protein [Candidatus Methanovirga aequatorialis]